MGLAESRAAAKLNHPHVCIVYAVEEEDGLPLIAMEYVDGRPLSQVIADGLDRACAWKLAAQVASGLAAAHAERVVHGDLKPANIIVTRNGLAKILDFGLARSQPRSSSEEGGASTRQVTAVLPDSVQIAATVDYINSTMDHPAGIQGSLAYMSPEQACGLPATPASDVFSFGLTLIEMLTGRQAHEQHTPVELLIRLQTEDLASELARKVDDAYRDLLRSMLTRVPSHRPTMSDVTRKLAAIAGL